MIPKAQPKKKDFRGVVGSSAFRFLIFLWIRGGGCGHTQNNDVFFGTKLLGDVLTAIKNF
jgi:hypothetical protein